MCLIEHLEASINAKIHVRIANSLGKVFLQNMFAVAGNLSEVYIQSADLKL